MAKTYNVVLKYNPFHVTTEIFVNGEEEREDSRLKSLCRDRRLQEWIDDFIPMLAEETETKNIDIDFHGMPLDAEDLKDALRIYLGKHPECNYRIVNVHSKDPEKNRLKLLRDLYERAKEGPCKDLFLNEEVSALFEKALDPSFVVNVIATMSSGKSTFINALLGRTLLPSAHGACTANITRIRDDDSRKVFRARCLNQAGKELHGWTDASLELLEEWNANGANQDIQKRTATVEMEGDIPSSKQSEECDLVLVDTPGPNSALNPHHADVTNSAISKDDYSMVLYVLDAEHLAVKDDKDLLESVASAIKKGGRKVHDRFVFIANKIDEYGTQGKDTVSSAIAKAREYVVGCKIDDPMIVPASAQVCLDIRRMRNGEQIEDEVEQAIHQAKVSRFCKKQSAEHNAIAHVSTWLNSGCVERLQKRLSEAERLQDNNTIAELRTGIPVVEEMFNDFLKKYAVPKRLKLAVESFSSVEAEMKIAEQLVEKLDSNEAELAASVAKVAKLDNALSEMSEGTRIKKEIESIKYVISDEARALVREQLIHVNATIDEICTEFENAGEVNNAEARGYFDRALAKCNAADSRVFSAFERSLEEEYSKVLDSLAKKYKKFVEDTLDEEFPNDEGMKKLSETVLKLPSVDALVSEHSHDKEIGRISSWKRDGFWGTLFSTNWFTDYPVNDKYVNLADEGLQEKVTISLKKASERQKERFEKFAHDNVDSAKQQLLDAMKDINSRIAGLADSLRKAQTDMKKKSELRDNAKMKHDWYVEFRKELEGILCVYQ